ncbi:MAG: hypothetical protein M1837_006688 [Sclerophora amabilis]|nr:MAG: hypothetical protein M1837_006688 [Sclerophora amabilis]
MSFKRKRGQGTNQSSNDVDTSKPSALFKPTGGRNSTLSVALPSSIISNAQSHELKTSLAGQIARALAVFCVDEVVIFEDGTGRGASGSGGNGYHSVGNGDQSYTGYSNPSHFLMHILSYLETPPHLRKHLFPLHPNLRTAGTLPSLDMPHHLRADEWCQYREGVTLAEEPVTFATPSSNTSDSRKGKSKKSKTKLEETENSLVDAGLRRKVLVEGASIPPNTRVTIKFPSQELPPSTSDLIISGEAVSPDLLREEAGYYWGYSIRRAPSVSAVFTECAYDGGYDLSFGTSERGLPLREAVLENRQEARTTPPGFKHMLVVFGGVQGLEAAVTADEELARKGVLDPEALFDHWVNLHPGQGSRTIRTEEAVWMGLMGLRDVVENNTI